MKWLVLILKHTEACLVISGEIDTITEWEDLQYGHQTLNYVTWKPFIHYLPLYIPSEPVETGQSVSPSTYSLTWLYHIIILVVPSVCPAVLSSVQTRSPVINPCVYCPTLLHTARVELLWVSACTSTAVMLNTCPGELEISAGCLRFKGTPAGLESAQSTGLCHCFMFHTLWDWCGCCPNCIYSNIKTSNWIWNWLCWRKWITPQTLRGDHMLQLQLCFDAVNLILICQWSITVAL